MKISISEVNVLITQLRSKYTLTEIASVLGVRENTIYTWMRGLRNPPKLAREKLYGMAQAMLRKQKKEAKNETNIFS